MKSAFEQDKKFYTPNGLLSHAGIEMEARRALKSSGDDGKSSANSIEDIEAKSLE